MTVDFPTTNVFRQGYDPQQVDAFFAEAREAYEGAQLDGSFGSNDMRNAVFSLRRGGYDPEAVDGALVRLEEEFSKREREHFVAEYGKAKWDEMIGDRAVTLYPRLLRPNGQRFSHPEGAFALGYDSVAVDNLLMRLTNYFDNGAPLTAAEVRAAQFKRGRGKKAYREDQVDAYLARAVEILQSAD